MKIILLFLVEVLREVGISISEILTDDKKLEKMKKEFNIFCESNENLSSNEVM